MVIVILASCSSDPASPLQEPSLDDVLIVRPEMSQIAGEVVGLETQAETYAVTLKFVGNPPASVKNALNAAKAKWQSAITQGISNVNINISCWILWKQPCIFGCSG